MPNIGTFNKIPVERMPQRPKMEPDTITVNDVTIPLRHVHDVDGYPMAEFCRMIVSPIPSKNALTQAIIQGVIEACLGDNEIHLFRSLSVGLLPDQIAKLALSLYEWWAAVPFESLPDLSVGDTPTSGNAFASSALTSEDSEQPESSEKSPDQIRLEAIVSSAS